MLSRQIAELGIYPAVDPLDSTSRMLDPRVIGDVHYETARATQKLLQDYKGLQVSSILLWSILFLEIIGLQADFCDTPKVDTCLSLCR